MPRWWDKFPKKLTAMVVGILVQLIPGVSQNLKEEVRNIVIGYMGAQGIADLNKPKPGAEERHK